MHYKNLHKAKITTFNQSFLFLDSAIICETVIFSNVVLENAAGNVR